MYSQVCKQFQIARRECGMTHSDLSKRSGIDPHIIHKLERGDNGVKVRTLEKLLAVMGYSIEIKQ